MENAVGILEKGFFHELEERRYFSLKQFNEDLWEKLDELNDAPFKKKEHLFLYRKILYPAPGWICARLVFFIHKNLCIFLFLDNCGIRKTQKVVYNHPIGFICTIICA